MSADRKIISQDHHSMLAFVFGFLRNNNPSDLLVFYEDIFKISVLTEPASGDISVKDTVIYSSLQ